MGCCHYFTSTDGGSDAFTVELPRATFGRGALGEVGARALGLGARRVALITDPWLAGSEHLTTVRTALGAAGIQVAEFSEVQVEPSDRSCLVAAEFLKEARVDAVVSVGGGSTLDTAKAALVYNSHPTYFLDYFASPIGGGTPVPGPVLPHIACPTTGGTGSEMTGLSVVRIDDLATKFVLASRFILPTEAIIDPACADSLPATVVACSGFDGLSHALECYTAKAYSQWARVDEPTTRPMIQGANPWSDLHAREALRLAGLYLERAVADAGDQEARDSMMWAASLAGMAFGNTGTHLPHAMSYGVSHLVRDFRAPDYPAGAGPFIPHGIGVIVNSPSVFRWTAQAAPQRHLEAAACLGADIRDAGAEDAGEVVAGRIIELMKGTGIPNGLAGVGFNAGDAGALADSCIRQGRAVANSPRECRRDDIEQIYTNALSYW